MYFIKEHGELLRKRIKKKKETNKIKSKDF